MHAVVIQKKYQIIPKYLLFADLLELRVDLIDGFCLSWAKFFLKKINKPWILTLRKSSQGGNFKGSEKLRLALIEKYLELCPTYLDLEYDVSLNFISQIKINHPKIKLIKSFHDYQQTPASLVQFIDKMYNESFDIHKFAFFANTIKDTLVMMQYLKKNNGKKLVSLIAMGKYGHPLRIIGKILKNAICYSAANTFKNKVKALSIKTLITLYDFNQLNDKTQIFALIGENISHSIGHLFHNFFFQEKKINAVYIKIPLKENELNYFFEVADDLEISGISVTTPFKNLLPQDIVKTTNPINTLKKIKSNWVAKNTDGLGLLQIIKPYKIPKTKILLIGAGPTAVEIFNSLQKKNYSVEVFNRSYRRALLSYPEKTKIIKKLQLGNYVIVINSASYKSLYTEQILQRKLKKKLILIDINYQRLFKKVNLNINFINGYELFFNQAIYQQIFWNNQSFSFKIIEKFKKKWMSSLHQF
jgi:3-dehydroquinate dehydratase / shikimate dehydrogenase